MVSGIWIRWSVYMLCLCKIGISLIQAWLRLATEWTFIISFTDFIWFVVRFDHMVCVLFIQWSVYSPMHFAWRNQMWSVYILLFYINGSDSLFALNSADSGLTQITRRNQPDSGWQIIWSGVNGSDGPFTFSYWTQRIQAWLRLATEFWRNIHHLWSNVMMNYIDYKVYSINN
jgi:hypothetical protein